MTPFSLVASICSLFSLVTALPIMSPVARDVWTPPIIYPNSSTIWVAGNNYTVTWNITGEPSMISNPVGELYLRHDGENSSIPIAEGFLLSAGEANVAIPSDTPPSTDWIVNLFGDSGDWSAPFTINAPSS